jgi:hypothetical protein
LFFSLSKMTLFRRLRGGSWLSCPGRCGSVRRDYSDLNRAQHRVGFRVVCLSAGPDHRPQSKPLRGSSWISVLWYGRSACRGHDRPDNAVNGLVGFRVVCPLVKQNNQPQQKMSNYTDSPNWKIYQEIREVVFRERAEEEDVSGFEIIGILRMIEAEAVAMYMTNEE